MTKVTQADLDKLVAVLNEGRHNVTFKIDRVGDYWNFEAHSPQSGTNLFSARTRRELYKLIHAFKSGIAFGYDSTVEGMIFG